MTDPIHFMCRLFGHKFKEDGRCWIQRPNPTTHIIVPLTIVKVTCVRCTLVGQAIIEGFHGDGDKSIIQVLDDATKNIKLSDPRKADSEIIEGTSVDDFLNEGDNDADDRQL